MYKLYKKEPDSVEHFLYSCTMFKNDVNDNFEYMAVEYKWKVILTDSGYTHSLQERLFIDRVSQLSSGLTVLNQTIT